MRNMAGMLGDSGRKRSGRCLNGGIFWDCLMVSGLYVLK